MADSDEDRLEIAAFRRRVIAEAVEAGEGGLAAAIASAAAEQWKDPSGRSVRFGERTLWRWLAAQRRGGLLALRPSGRKDSGQARALSPELVELASSLRKQKPSRPTKTIIDILVRKKLVEPGEIARSTLDRYFFHHGLSRRALGSAAVRVFQKIETESPLELVVGDFHHGPYVRTHDDEAKRALLLAFIDHFSRYVPEGRYYLHEDFAALRFGFRHLLASRGLMIKMYLDNGPAFHATRFAAGCAALGIDLVHSKPYQSEGRGVVERFNRTLLEQFESEVKGRDPLPTLDELNAFFEAWLSERYHRDIHSETHEAPLERFTRNAVCRPAPDLATVDEWLRLRQKRTVHSKWSTVEIEGRRFRVDASLRGRRVDVLYDPFDLAYVLIAHDGRVIERALPHKGGALPAEQPKAGQSKGEATDYLALLRTDYERRTSAELSALRLRPVSPQVELSLPDLVIVLERCRAAALCQAERAAASALWRRLRPIDATAATTALENAHRRLGSGLHVDLYLDALSKALLRSRSSPKKEKTR